MFVEGNSVVAQSDRQWRDTMTQIPKKIINTKYRRSENKIGGGNHKWARRGLGEDCYDCLLIKTPAMEDLFNEINEIETEPRSLKGEVGHRKRMIAYGRATC
jgi:hypothetical protein